MVREIMHELHVQVLCTCVMHKWVYARSYNLVFPLFFKAIILYLIFIYLELYELSRMHFKEVFFLKPKTGSDQDYT